MRKTVHFVFVVMLFYAGLTACLAPSGNLTPQAAETAQPQVTVALQATVTSTATPAPALSPEMEAAFKDSKVYTLKPDGQIEQTIDGTTSIVEEIKGIDGTMVFTTPEGEKMQAIDV